MKSHIIIILLILLFLLAIVCIYKRYTTFKFEKLKKRVIKELKNINSYLIEKGSVGTSGGTSGRNSIVYENFGGLDSWFSNDASSQLRISPPHALGGGGGDYDDSFQDADNNMILNGGVDKPIKIPTIPSKKEPSNIKEISVHVPVPAPVPVPVPAPANLLSSLQCQFFSESCPEKYKSMGNFSIEGGNLSCGNIVNTKPAKAVAEIKNNTIYDIHITDPGHGFNPQKPPKVTIQGGRGRDATAEAIVGDDGFLKVIKITNAGFNYTETPNVMIDAPFMNSSCTMCCKEGP